jgi:hypothetical protein
LTDVLKAAGSSWDKVVKVNIYLKSMGDFAAINEEYIKVCLIIPSDWDRLINNISSFSRTLSRLVHVFKLGDCLMT